MLRCCATNRKVAGSLGTLTSWNPLGLPRPVMGLLYVLFVVYYCHRLSTELQLTNISHHIKKQS